MTQETKDEILEIGQRLMEAFEEFDNALRSHDRREWERWKAGGKAVSDDFVSMYPSAAGIINDVSEAEVETEDEDTDEGDDGETE